MAKRKKPTALQRRRQKEKERKERRLYEQGLIEPVRPKKAKAKKQEQERRRQQQQQHYMQHKHTLEKLKKQELQDIALGLFNEAYRKYYHLKSNGISNVATSIYEADFAGHASYLKTLNKNSLKGVIRDLRKWLDRKDVQYKRAKRAFDKNMQRWGFSNAYEAASFWRDYKKWRETSDEASNADGSPPGVDEFMQAWYSGRESGSELDHIFDDADTLVRADYEASAPDMWDLPEPPDYDDDDEDDEDDGEYDDFFFT